MKLWKLGAVIGAVLGLISIIEFWCLACDLILVLPEHIVGLLYYIFGSSTLYHYVLFFSVISIGALIGAGIGYVFKIGSKLRE